MKNKLGTEDQQQRRHDGYGFPLIAAKRDQDQHGEVGAAIGSVKIECFLTEAYRHKLGGGRQVGFAPFAGKEATGEKCGYCPPSDVGEFRLEREGEIIRCPWHGWEFDIKTGCSIFNPREVKTARYDVLVGSNDEAGESESPEVETFPVALKDHSIFVKL